LVGGSRCKRWESSGGIIGRTGAEDDHQHARSILDKASSALRPYATIDQGLSARARITLSVLVSVPDAVRSSGEPLDELVILTLDLLSYVTNVAPPFRPRLSVWTRITVRALKFCVGSVLICTFNVKIVKRAVNYF
jgi:hypothetical protein